MPVSSKMSFSKTFSYSKNTLGCVHQNLVFTQENDIYKAGILVGGADISCLQTY